MDLPETLYDALAALLAALAGWLMAWFRTRQLAREERETAADVAALDRRLRRMEGTVGRGSTKRDEELAAEVEQLITKAKTDDAPRQKTGLLPARGRV